MKISLFFLVLFHSAMFLEQEPMPEYNFHKATLCMGDTMNVGEKTIKFKKLISDSRCPRGNGINCIWAGEVTVLVAFYENGEYKGEKLIAGTNNPIGETEIISNAAVSLSEFFNAEIIKLNGIVVTPYPEAGKKIAPEEYSLELQVAEKLETH